MSWGDCQDQKEVFGGLAHSPILGKKGKGKSEALQKGVPSRTARGGKWLPLFRVSEGSKVPGGAKQLGVGKRKRKKKKDFCHLKGWGGGGEKRIVCEPGTNQAGEKTSG